MQLSELGEFALIERLTKDIPLSQPSTIKGAGDDAAVLAPSAEKRTLITSDMLMEGIHFDLVYTPLKHLGYKAAMVNFSDIYAMNGRPTQLLVNIAVGRRIEVEHLDDLYDGLRLACERHGVDLVGGDTTSSKTGLALSLTCIGEVAPESITLRSGAKDTDLICVSGNLGAAYMGMQLMEREKAIFESQRHGEAEVAQPDFSGREYLIERYLKPEARKDIVERLAEAGLHPTSMIDISDGLASELKHLCKQGNVGCRVYEERIPIDYQTAVMAEELNLNVITCALGGGEDYELLFTVPIADHEKVAAMKDVRVIGHIVSDTMGLALITRDGVEMQIKAQGWTAQDK